MTEWVDQQLALLRTQWPDLTYLDDGHWVRVDDWVLPAGWAPTELNLAFQIKPTAGEPPYAFYVSSTDVAFNGQTPQSWTPAASVPFDGTWSVFSWAPETWIPTVNPHAGPNMLAFARSFSARFAEGA